MQKHESTVASRNAIVCRDYEFQGQGLALTANLSFAANSSMLALLIDPDVALLLD